jgi:hypothetical protein
MKTIKKISGFIMLAIILFSSMGISFYLHECDCRGTNLYSIGTGYSGPKSFCCCPTKTQIYVNIDLEGSIDAEGCCKDLVYFYLLPFSPEKDNTGLPRLSEKVLFSFIPVNSSETVQSIETKTIPLFLFPPDKLSGKNLIFFIQQIKIPSPVC